jgi:outer membrane protein assembly factor BamB
MRRSRLVVALSALVCITLTAADWPMPAGNPQRNGWAGSERQITKANVNQLKLLYKYQTDNQNVGSMALTPPIVSGNLITFRGFKEMLMFAGSSGKVYSVDADLNRLIWESNIPADSAADSRTAGASSPACPGGVTSPIVMAGSSSSSLHFATLASQAPAAAGAATRRRSPYFPPLEQSIYPLLPTTLTQLNALYAVSGDGDLHVLNSSTGQDLIPPMHFVPAGLKVTSLNLRDNVAYATTAGSCNGSPNALFALDLLSPQKTVRSFDAPLGEFAGSAATAIGNDGTIYVQIAFAPENQPGHFFDAVVALTPKELKVKDYVLLGKKQVKKSKSGGFGITPVVFSAPFRDLILAASQEGTAVLLDSRSLGGADHRTPLFATSSLLPKRKDCPNDGFRGTFSTWLDADTGVRRFYAPVKGPLGNLSSKSSENGPAHGSLLALQLAGTNEQPTLQQSWVSRDFAAPSPAIIGNGLVFVLSTGAPSCALKKSKKHAAADSETGPGTSATLYALDALTGKELYASSDLGGQIPADAALALANGRVYFTSSDNAVYCFGIPAQQKQVVEQ